jgi:hypothetical protein
MQRKTGIKVVLMMGLVGLAVALIAACGGGVSQEDYDAVQQQLATKEQEAATAKQQLAAAQAGSAQATALQQQIAAKDKEIADLNTSLAAAQERNPLIWTKLLPTPAPRATATPAPPGYVAPTAVPPPAELVNEVVPFTFYVETLTGHQVTTVAGYPLCVPNSQFRQGEHLVWRFEVFDTSTGKRLTGLDTDVTIKVVLPNGEEKISRYSKRGGTGPWMWSSAFTIPLDYPLGTFDYQIVVTKGGRTGTFDQDNVALVNKDRGIDSRLQIVK